MKFQLKTIFVARQGFTDFKIPIFEIGKGKPLLSIVAGIHGNETSSLLILDKLIERLPSKMNGKLRLILSANPSALVSMQREGIDKLDLNRIFPGDSSKSLSNRFAAELLKRLKDSDIVIDLHSFEMGTPLMGILVKSNNQSLNEQNIESINCFSPKQCWVIDSDKNSENQFGKSLGQALNNLGIKNFAIELENPEIIKENEIEECVNGLLRILNSMGMLKFHSKKNKFSFFNRTAINCETEGIFIPQMEIFSEVKKGEVLGIIRCLPEGINHQVLSPSNGILMQISRKKFSTIGQEIASVGEEVLSNWATKGGKNDKKGK